MIWCVLTKIHQISVAFFEYMNLKNKFLKIVCYKPQFGFFILDADYPYGINFHALKINLVCVFSFWLIWFDHTVRTLQPPPVKTFCLLPNVSAICLVRRPLMGLAYFTKSFQFPFLILTHQNSTALHSVCINSNLIKFDS